MGSFHAPCTHVLSGVVRQKAICRPNAVGHEWPSGDQGTPTCGLFECLQMFRLLQHFLVNRKRSCISTRWHKKLEAFRHFCPYMHWSQETTRHPGAEANSATSCVLHASDDCGSCMMKGTRVRMHFPRMANAALRLRFPVFKTDCPVVSTEPSSRPHGESQLRIAGCLAAEKLAAGGTMKTAPIFWEANSWSTMRIV